jgi:N-acetylglucosaminyldiphosphoundecaprenol N-acetyl-beta-D-mannosaminyltransferase
MGESINAEQKRDNVDSDQSHPGGMCGNVRFRTATAQSAVEEILALAMSREVGGTHIHLANAYSVVLADRNVAVADSFRAGICYPDGLPVVWALNALDRRQEFGRVRGPSLFEDVLVAGVRSHTRHYLMGSTDATLAKLRASLEENIPGVSVVGATSPPFRVMSSEDWDSELDPVRIANPDIVWVGLGTPKQDLVAQLLSSKYPAVYICVGAAFDFSAGNLKHAPQWMQKSGTEWLYRFIQEPGRLWRRYLIGNAQFVAIVSRQILKQTVRGWRARR